MAKRKLRARCYTKDFIYTPAVSTDLSKTFARVRQEQAETKKKLDTIVTPIKQKVGTK